MFDFLRVAYIIYIITPILITFDFSIKTKKECLRKMCKIIYNSIGINLYRASDMNISYEKNIIYFSNHRTFIDFCIEHIITHYNSLFLSRWLVAFFIPLTYYCKILTNNVIFFKRKNTNIVNFENMLKLKQQNKDGYYLMVYPEGTRRTGKNYACDLKKGVIYYSYKNDCPIQFIITYGKDDSFNEKTFVQKKCNAYVFYSKVYRPDKEKYLNMEDWYNYINNEWKNEFDYIYSKNYTEKDIIEKIDPDYIHDNNYPINKYILNLSRVIFISSFCGFLYSIIKYII